MGLVDITSLSRDELVEAIEQTELIFIIGMWSCSSLHRASLSPNSERVSSFFTGVWRVWSEKGATKGDLSSDYYSYITCVLLFVQKWCWYNISDVHGRAKFHFLRVWQWTSSWVGPFVSSYNRTLIPNFIMRLHGKSWDWVLNYKVFMCQFMWHTKWLQTEAHFKPWSTAFLFILLFAE